MLLLALLGDQLVALPADGVERVLRMAALSPLADASPTAVGLIDLQGSVLAVVDPRPRMGIATPRPRLDHRLVIASATTRFVLWVDAVERIISTTASDFEVLAGADERAVALSVVRHDGQVVPVLSLESLDPGPLLQSSTGRPA